MFPSGMAAASLVRTPDGISIVLLQEGAALPPAEPWLSMASTGSW